MLPCEFEALVEAMKATSRPIVESENFMLCESWFERRSAGAEVGRLLMFHKRMGRGRKETLRPVRAVVKTVVVVRRSRKTKKLRLL